MNQAHLERRRQRCYSTRLLFAILHSVLKASRALWLIYLKDVYLCLTTSDNYTDKVWSHMKECPIYIMKCNRVSRENLGQHFLKAGWRVGYSVCACSAHVMFIHIIHYVVICILHHLWKLSFPHGTINI